MKSKKRKILAVGAVALCVGAHAKADDLDSKSIQVEQQFHGGQWVPLDPLTLDHGTSYQGYAVGMPDIRVDMVAVQVGGKIGLTRDFSVLCHKDGVGVRATFSAQDANKPWNARLISACGDLRFTLVDTAKALHERRGALGEVPELAAPAVKADPGRIKDDYTAQQAAEVYLAKQLVFPTRVDVDGDRATVLAQVGDLACRVDLRRDAKSKPGDWLVDNENCNRR